MSLDVSDGSDVEVLASTSERPPDDRQIEQAAPPEPTGSRGLFFLIGLLAVLGLLAGLPALVVVLGFLFMIFMHELGHYVTAKSAGMQVTEFFLGFGPRLWSFRRGETEYGVKAIPLGAYVKVTGMSNLEPVDPALESRTYRQAPYWRRMSVALAGSAMHFVMAFATLLTLFAFMGYHGLDGAPADSWVVNRVLEDTAAEKMGLELGDRIVGVDGVDLATFGELAGMLTDMGGQDLDVAIVRDGQNQSVSGVLGARYVFEELGFSAIVNGGDESDWYLTPDPGVDTWAQLSTLREEDRILAVNGAEVSTPRDLISALADVAPTSPTLLVARETYEVELNSGSLVRLDPEAVDRRGFLGIGPGSPEPEPLGLVQGFSRASSEFAEVARLSTDGLVNFFSPDGLAAFFGFGPADSASSANGSSGPATVEGGENRVLSPVGAVRLGSSSVDVLGWSFLLSFFVLINIFVGIFNLIPLLPFDGGHALIATYERLRSWGGKRHFADIRNLIPVTYAVVGLMLAVFSMALYLDITDPISF